MGNNNALSQLLRSLCHNTHWKYAVFWKFDCWNHMQLYWEDAYFDSTTSSISLQNVFLGGKSSFMSFSSELDAKDRKSSECPVRLAVTNLSSHIYILGEGIVGNVALKKKHEWIFPGEYSSKLLPECHEDCQLQFAAGIKTILLVPINSLGVVQLGSLHKIKVDGHNTPGNEVHKNGASWAYEVGGQPQVCPLIVENLDQPGQMLVEMLCKEYGLFLEIVQVIKCLKLTILKGVMETRSNELWAHFIIEGSRGFYRMDIILPLMQLLQRN